MKFFALLLCIALLPSCISNKKNLRDHQGTYLENVKLNFEAGLDALKAEEFDKAVTYFQFVKSKYPFSIYAALSDLRIADTKFAQKKWLDAASAYEVFIRLHPRHEQTAFAYYRVGISYFNAVPSNFFLMPKATTRDPSFAKDALLAIERFILQYPDSEHIPDALAKQQLLFSFLAKHHQHVASYYLKRKKYEAAIERYLTVDNLYHESPEALESLFLAAEIYAQKLEEPKEAIDLYERIIAHPQESSYKEKAAKLKEKLELKMEN